MRRITIQRIAIKQVFEQSDRPLRIEEILRAGRVRVPALNQATVYRNLKLLAEEGWILKIIHSTLGTLYERAGKEHHHHFHCRICNQILELQGCAFNEEQAIPEGFLAESHEIFLSGICSSCSSRGFSFMTSFAGETHTL